MKEFPIVNKLIPIVTAAVLAGAVTLAQGATTPATPAAPASETRTQAEPASPAAPEQPKKAQKQSKSTKHAKAQKPHKTANQTRAQQREHAPQGAAKGQAEQPAAAK